MTLTPPHRRLSADPCAERANQARDQGHRHPDPCVVVFPTAQGRNEPSDAIGRNGWVGWLADVQRPDLGRQRSAGRGANPPHVGATTRVLTGQGYHVHCAIAIPNLEAAIRALCLNRLKSLQDDVGLRKPRSSFR
jgi:hypothetical protein